MPQVPYVAATYTTSASAAQLNHLEQGVNDVSYAPAVRAFNNANISITTSGADQVLTFNSERYDQAGNTADTMHDNVTNSSRLTCRYAGVYSITAQVQFASNATGVRRVQVRLNGATVIASVMVTANNGVATDVICPTDYLLAVNDYVECMVLQSSGGALNAAFVANYSPEFSMKRVG